MTGFYNGNKTVRLSCIQCRQYLSLYAVIPKWPLRFLIGWLTMKVVYGAAPPWFRNQPGEEVTVRVDSKVVEDMEEGGTKDEPSAYDLSWTRSARRPG